MKGKGFQVLLFCFTAIIVNVILATIIGKLSISFLFLDTIGTIFIAVLYGPWYGAAVGTATNLVIPLMTGNPRIIPFFVVNALVGIVVGYIAKRFKFDLSTAVLTGVVLSIICPLVATPIAVWLFEGITGSGNDAFILWLERVGGSIFASSFIPRVTSNLIDKIGSCVLVYFLIRIVPDKYK